MTNVESKCKIIVRICKKCSRYDIQRYKDRSGIYYLLNMDHFSAPSFGSAILKCEFGLRLNITVKTRNCSGVGEPTKCWGHGRCASNVHEVRQYDVTEYSKSLLNYGNFMWLLLNYLMHDQNSVKIIIMYV